MAGNFFLIRKRTYPRAALLRSQHVYIKHLKVARPERVELPTFWFVARRSIQLSYGRVP